MARLLIPFLVLTVSGCNGNKDDEGTDDSGTGPEGATSFTYVSEVNAKAFESELPVDQIATHQAINTLFAATGMVVADVKVQDRLNVNGGGDYRQSLDCWTRPDFPMFDFTIDYTGCFPYGVSGGVNVEDHPSGPLLFNFLNFTITERQIDGVLGYDTRGAFPDSLFWQNYDTDIVSPGPDNRTGFGVNVDGEQYAMSYVGGSNVNFLQQELSLWGTTEVATVGGDATLVVHGGATAAEVLPDDPPGANSLKLPLNWLECRCPTGGVSTYNMEIAFTEITIDMDDLEDEPDAIDDPELIFPVEFRVPGTAAITYTGCGTYEVDYQVDEYLHTLDSAQLKALISFQCDIKAIDDNQRCLAMFDAADKLGSFDVKLGANKINTAATSAINGGFDSDWCVPAPE